MCKELVSCIPMSAWAKFRPGVSWYYLVEAKEVAITYTRPVYYILYTCILRINATVNCNSLHLCQRHSKHFTR